MSPAVAACSGNDDGDLVPPTQGENGVGGNILIIQEANRTLDDDVAGNGVITFTLNSGPAFSLPGVSAIDEGSFSLGSGGWMSGALTPGGNGVTRAFTFAAPSPLINVRDSVSFTCTGSVSIDSLVIAAPVPLPAGAVLLLGALGGLGVMGRRAHRAA